MAKFIISVLTFFLLSFNATAQWQPPGPIKIVVPYAPGGSTDKWARVVGKIFSDHGWKNYIENNL
jgi:tripartite-type tricarboxylate transporter receptor subunit TctC